MKPNAQLTPYTYKQTKKITELIKQLEKYQFFIQHAPISSQARKVLHSETYLKSSLFSAKIEGNPLTLDQVRRGTASEKTKEKLEISNITKALTLVFSTKAPRNLSISFIKKLHRITLNNLDRESGKFRREMTAIFDQAGVAVYLTPSPEEIEPLLKKFLTYIKKTQDNPFIKAAISHFWFEKIHPFVDGNGRVGRLITQHVIDTQGKFFQGLLSFEEQIEATRSEYYYFLQNETKDVTDFIEYFLECCVITAQNRVKEIKNQPNEPQEEDLLLPRRKEIVTLLKEHQYLSFDQIHRRFFAVNPNTLRYDLRKLAEQGFIKKIGSTRGALYQISKK